jgi:hypothetical protein
VAITIDREQRDAIYEEILTELTGTGDIWAELQSGDYDAARRTRDRLADDMRLLDDLGWEPEPNGSRFEMTMEPVALAQALRTLNDAARSTLHEQIIKPIDEADLARRALVTQTACGDVLAQIAAERSDG